MIRKSIYIYFYLFIYNLRGREGGGTKKNYKLKQKFNIKTKSWKNFSLPITLI